MGQYLFNFSSVNLIMVSTNLENPENSGKNELTQRNHGKLRGNDEVSGKIISIAALS